MKGTLEGYEIVESTEEHESRGIKKVVDGLVNTGKKAKKRISNNMR